MTDRQRLFPTWVYVLIGFLVVGLLRLLGWVRP